MTPLAKLIKIAGLSKHEAAEWYGIRYRGLCKLASGESVVYDDTLNNFLVLAKSKHKEQGEQINVIEADLKARE